MKRLLALSGIGLSVTFGVMTSVAVPKIMLIALDMLLSTLPDRVRGLTDLILLDLLRDFFTPGGISTTELIIGL